MSWNKAITTAGYQLIAQALLGTRIVFTRLVVGDGIRNTGFDVATGAVQERYSLPILSVLRNGSRVTVTSGIAPDDLEEGYDLKEIVVFAKPEGGEEICFSAACNAENAIHVDPNSANVSMDGKIRWAYEISPEGNVTIETGGLLWADYDHRHDNATETEDGFMAAEDKAALEDLKEHVHDNATEAEDGFMAAGDKAAVNTLKGTGNVQGVGTQSSPSFKGMSITGTNTYIDASGVLHGVKYEA